MILIVIFFKIQNCGRLTTLSRFFALEYQRLEFQPLVGLLYSSFDTKQLL